MTICTRPLTTYGLAVLTAAVALTGCGSAEPKDGSSASPSPAGAPAPRTTPRGGAKRRGRRGYGFSGRGS
ncbi:hypothetical protein [Streptomyces sp. NBC_00158]|uniref:hypothetical protein n=1 Tax=Streptomyces sp. NBC_00158 TaxID=2903627 RepID=UPI00324E279D